MSRAIALDILTAAFGQMISVSQEWRNGRKWCRLHKITHLGWGDTTMTLAGEGENWYELIKQVLPEAIAHYDNRFDTIEQSYIDSLVRKRKTKTLIQVDN